MSADLVSTVAYDSYGRVPFQYLPFAANTAGGNTSVNDGHFKRNPFQQQAGFYNTGTTNSPLYGQGEAWLYSHTQYEASPLSRVTKTLAPGNAWVGGPEGGRGVAQAYELNRQQDSVRIWNVTNNATMGELGTYATSGMYGPGQLHKNSTIDEEGNKVVEYQDKEGKVILKKVQLDKNPSVGHTGWLSTYYLYDDLNQLRAVIQPSGVAELAKPAIGWNFNNAPVLLSEQCFRYEYDERGRMVVKKVPGPGKCIWSTMPGTGW